MIRNNFATKFIAATAFIAIFQCSTKISQAHSDVFLAQSNGQVVVGGAHELGEIDENFDITTRVFEGVMISSFPPFNPADYGRDEPGFDALASGSALMPPGASSLPATSSVAINLAPFTVGANADTLFYWNGAGSVNFQPISTAQPGVAMSLDPDPLGTTSASGAFHEHAIFGLDNGAAGVPADGVYLIAPTASVTGLADSEHFFMLWLVDSLLDDEDAAEGLEDAFANGETVYLGKDFAFFPAAISHVETNLVPEPSSIALGMLALTAVGASVRRRRSIMQAEA
jgi:hypothetical protein